MNDFYSILKNKAKDFVKILSEIYDINYILISPNSKYSCAIKFSNYKLLLYYSPKKKSFKLVVNYQNIYDFLINKKMPNDLAIVSTSTKIKHQNNEELPDGFNIFVDGSFHNNKISSAYVIIKNNQIISQDCKLINKQDFLANRNIAGEIYAVAFALSKAKELNVKEVNIYFDYMGLREWATGKWQRKNELTQKYHEFIQNCGININWIKIKAHSANKWNNYVDMLAKKCITNS